MTGPSNNAEAIKDTEKKPVEIKPVEIKKPAQVEVKKIVVQKKKDKKPEKKINQKFKKPEKKKEDKKPKINPPPGGNKEKENAKVLIAPAPAFKLPVGLEAAASARRMNIIIEENTAKKGIRRSALEVKKAQDLEEQKKIKQEEEWEIPAFLRRVKFKS